MASELTLDAALRDSESPNPSARNQAVRNLAAALLLDLHRSSPAWNAAHDHPRGAEVLARFDAALADDEQAPIRGLALVGLAQIGEARLLDYAQLWIDAPTPTPEAGEAQDDHQLVGRRGANAFLRECAVIALGLLGDAAARAGSDESWTVATRCRDTLRDALQSEHDDVRFQACMSLAELGGDSAEIAIVAALAAEQVDAVRANQVAALSVFDPPSEASCEQLRAFIEDPKTWGDRKRGDPRAATSYNAALALAAARDRGALPRLCAAVDSTDERDRALEAIAALGPPIDERTLGVIRKLARNRLAPGLTRVRCAYALCRLSPTEGHPLLARLGRSLRPAVREAVADARVALEVLERSDSQAQGTPSPG